MGAPPPLATGLTCSYCARGQRAPSAPGAAMIRPGAGLGLHLVALGDTGRLGVSTSRAFFLIACAHVGCNGATGSAGLTRLSGIVVKPAVVTSWVGPVLSIHLRSPYSTVLLIVGERADGLADPC
jgi:hypothetical protein